ncbi:MAG: cytochrome c oxidase accessory protein CcoG [Vitreoscilla sp.]|nr:cytochrome c oxidase accessory protein CcoG [Vitreoscilla sp.]
MTPPVIPIQPVIDKGTPLYAAEAKVYPRSVKGIFANWRWIAVWLTQLVFYGAPWLTYNGRQALLFDLEAGRFYVFGLVLYPQDFIYLAALMVIAALLLFFLTAIAGRVWCGYSCPQTVYTEIFMWFEQRIEGDRQARMRLDAAPWSANKLLRKGGKQLAWWAFALVTGFTFVGYFVPIHTLAAEAAALAFTPWEWFWVLFYSGATYGNAGFLREQMCKYICPYARFQSALIDKDSLIITYDAARGEPRGSRGRGASAAALGQGDCIDCTLCVQVCPTGIDIRKGLQNECIACAACVDACDNVMDKIGSPRGLIRYATENGVAQHWRKGAMLRRVLRARVLVYATVLTLLCVAFGVSLAHRGPLLVDIIKDRNTLARVVENGQVENVYRLQIHNRTEAALHLRVRVSGLTGLAAEPAPEITLAPAAIGALAVQVRLPFEQAQSKAGNSHPILFELQTDPVAGQDAGSVVREASTFFVPR